MAKRTAANIYSKIPTMIPDIFQFRAFLLYSAAPA